MPALLDKRSFVASDSLLRFILTSHNHFLQLTTACLPAKIIIDLIQKHVTPCCIIYSVVYDMVNNKIACIPDKKG